MNRRILTILLLLFGILILVIIAATAVLTPGDTNPAFQTAVGFAEAAATGDEAGARASTGPSVLDYAAANCPSGQISACVASYIPPEWGAFKSVVFRRAAPDGSDWDVELIATYSEGVGFSGVCIYTRLSPVESGWQVTRYAGWVPCSDPSSRDIQSNPDAPHHVP